MPFASHDLSDLAEDERARCMVELAHEAQGSFDLAAGPLLRAVHFRLGSQAPDRLLIIPHHLLVDGMSRGILLEDLQSLCRQLAAGAEPTLPPKTTSLQYWGRRLEEYARSAEVRAELPFWLAQTFDDDCADLPVDFPDGKPTCVSYDTLIGHLEPAETTAVREGARKLGMKLGELLIGVVSGWLVDRTGRKDCTIALAGHGREDLFAEVDLSRTVGWFQVYYPMRLRDPGAGLASVRDQLAQVRNNGIGYSLLRYCSGDSAASEALAAVRPPVVSVNFMGDFSFAGTPIGTEMFGVPPLSTGRPRTRTGSGSTSWTWCRPSSTADSPWRSTTATTCTAGGPRRASCGSCSAGCARSPPPQESETVKPHRPSGFLAFTTIWLGQLLSTLGTRMTTFALSIWIWQQTGHATDLALMTFAGFLATAVFSPLAGSLIDRWNRRLTIVLSDVGSGAATVLLLVLFATGSAQVWQLYAVNVLTGAFLAFQTPAYSSTISLMMRKGSSRGPTP